MGARRSWGSEMPNREEEKQRRPPREPPDLRALAKRLKDMEDARSRQMPVWQEIAKYISPGRGARWRSGEEVALAARRTARSLRQAVDRGRTGARLLQAPPAPPAPSASSGPKCSWKVSSAPALAPRQP